MYYYSKDPILNFSLNNNESNRLKNELKLIKKYFERYDELSNREKRELISHFMNFEYDTKDICLITNSIVKNGHNMIMNIPSKMEYASSKNDKRDEYTYNEVNYLVTTRDDFNIESKRFSRDELMHMYYTRLICPIYEYPKELWNFSDDKEQYKRITTLKDIGVNVEPLPEFELYDINFNEGALYYQDLLFDDSNIIKPSMDLRVKMYLNNLIEKSKKEAIHEEEKKYVRRLDNYKKSKVN